MRWEGLFADLEGQLAAEERRELDDEVAERTRRERALVLLAARVAAALGSSVQVALDDASRLDGELLDLGEDWMLIRAVDRREVLVPLAAVVTLRGLGPQAAAARSARRFALGYALRELARNRAPVTLALAGGGTPLLGTIDAVGADHLDLAEHPLEVPRRRANVRSVATVPFRAVLSITSHR